MTSAQEKFQALLRELFQFDCADLDFGIYRIMNYKRDVIEKFISTDLPEAVAEELDRGSLAEHSQAAAELKEIAAQIKKNLGIDALDADGRLITDYHATPLGEKYLGLQAKAAGGRGREALEASIFNHLYSFFSRYYQDGDFISKHRYSKRQKYAIPYNGEEVYLYWANHDQYYVKTAEHFHDYTFTSCGVTVHFKLTAANVEQNNVKGDKRFFLPRVKELDWNEKADELIIPFEFRSLIDQEKVTYGTKNQQDKINAEALEAIPGRLSPKEHGEALAAITAERHKNSDGESVSFLEHHLRQYTRRNTSDFFIHKDLKGFLSRELDFYLKNEVLNLDEMETAGEDRAEGWFQMVRVIKAVGSRIIDFLDQIESFQKMLWEKRKFITETQYCITVDNIDESFYGDIAACDAQWTEWKEIFHINEEQADLFTSGKSRKDRRIAFLKGHPTLVLDTKHFDRDFVDRLLGSFDDLDRMTDGLLIHSENSQALNLLRSSLQDTITCIFIDPPYNTGTDGFPYKDGYQHSSWIAMMTERLRAARSLLTDRGTIWSTIDDGEVHRLKLAGEGIFGPQNFIANVVWQKKYTRANDARWFSDNHDHLLVFAREKNSVTFNLQPRSESQTVAYSNPDNHPKGPWKATPLHAKSGSERAFTYRFRNGVVWSPPPGTYPRYSTETLERLEANDEIWFGRDGRSTPSRKTFLREAKEGVTPITIWGHDEVGHNHEAIEQLKALFPENPFPNPKPTRLIGRVFQLGAGQYDCLLDFFAGSGTTAQAVVELNRVDGGRRKHILVEMGGYFESVLLPRIKKVTFSPEWKDGKPRRMATTEEAERSPRIVKYIRLESYEDALNNIAFDDVSGQGAMQFEDYLLKYMLKWETRKSETLLNVEKLTKPFSYKLYIHSDGQTREKAVDIPETFNYLLGLHVSTRKVYDDGRRYLVYHGRIDHRRIAVIWRETEGWTKEDLERDKKFVAEQKLTEGADEVFVNGDSFIPNAKALELVFKARMFAPVEA